MKIAKRSLSVLLSVLILISVLSIAPAYAAETYLNKVGTTYSGTTGDCTWNLDTSTGVLTTSGNGKMGSYKYSNDVPWYYYRDSIKTVVINNGVTGIGDVTFSSCTSLTSVTIPDSVTSIGGLAFYNCKNLKNVYYTGTSSQWSSISIGSDNTPLTSANIHYNSETTGDCTWNLDTASGVLTISGNGKMGSYKYSNDVPWNSYKNSIKTVVINKGVTSISGHAFSGCINLTSVTIPNSVTSIGSHAFFGCRSLTSVTIPNSVTSIGDWTFYDCKSLTSVTIPDSVTSIGNLAFCNCTSLIRVIIRDSVTSIGGAAFGGCTSLTSVTIPNSVTSIAIDAFTSCTSLTSITVDSTNKNYSTENGVLFNKEQTTLIQYPIGNTRASYSVPDSVTSIGDYAFRYCTSLTSVTIPNSVTSIGVSAFYNCTSLTSVTIPNRVTSIGSQAFFGCRSLTSVTIPNSVTSISTAAFHNCTHLKSVTIPDSVTSIGNGAFSDCTSLTSITIPDSVISIIHDAFWNCTSLKDVYYTGTSSQWNSISIGDNNAPLTSANIHYNYYGTIKPTQHLKKAQIITAKSYTKTYYSKAFNLKAKAKTKLSYKTSNKKVVTVSSKGKVTIKGCGKATITIKAAATSKYKSAAKKITITVKPKTVKVKSVSGKGNRIIVTFEKQKGLSGYDVEISKDKKFSMKAVKNLKGSKSSCKISGVVKGRKYYIRIRAKAKIGKKTVKTKWTNRTVTVR